MLRPSGTEKAEAGSEGLEPTVTNPVSRLAIQLAGAFFAFLLLLLFLSGGGEEGERCDLALFGLTFSSCFGLQLPSAARTSSPADCVHKFSNFLGSFSVAGWSISGAAAGGEDAEGGVAASPHVAPNCVRGAVPGGNCIDTPLGTVVGAIGVMNPNTREFLGIPYAQPPQRWMPPEAPEVSSFPLFFRLKICISPSFRPGPPQTLVSETDLLTGCSWHTITFTTMLGAGCL